MKPYYNGPKLLLLIIGVLPLFFSCELKPGIWKNSDIDAAKKAELHKLNDKVFKDLRAADLKDLENYMSGPMLESGIANRNVELISNDLKAGECKLFDEYYVVNQFRDKDTIDNKFHGANNYRLIYPGVAQEMYIALYLIKAHAAQWMLLTAYSKYNYGWKLTRLKIDTYALNGMTAPELYQLAKKQYDENYIADAANTMGLAYTCMQPVDIWVYPNYKEMSSFYGNVIGQCYSRYKFPMIIKQVATHPFIFRIANQVSADGKYYPAIYYGTKVKLKDTVALKNENLLMRKVIGDMIPGIDKDKKYVIYVAFNEPPNAKREVDRFEMDDQLR